MNHLILSGIHLNIITVLFIYLMKIRCNINTRDGNESCVVFIFIYIIFELIRGTFLITTSGTRYFPFPLGNWDTVFLDGQLYYIHNKW